MVSFLDLILNDVVAVVVRIPELFHFGTDEMRSWSSEDTTFTEGSVDRGLSGNDVTATRFHWVNLVDKRFDSLLIWECSLSTWQHALDTTGKDRAVSLEPFALQSDLVHHNSLLEVDLVVGFQGSVVLESGHSFLSVTFWHGFLEEVRQAIGKVGEALKSISQARCQSSPGHWEFSTGAHPFAFAFSHRGISETFSLDAESLTVDRSLDHGVERNLLAEACCTGSHLGLIGF